VLKGGPNGALAEIEKATREVFKMVASPSRDLAHPALIRVA
jgi:hypothetical protein